jgi:phosphopantetheinyl transferase
LGTVHCYRLELAAANESDLALLDAAERERAARFHFDKHRRRHVAAHAQLRRLLGRWLDTAPSHVPLTATANGKPVLGSQAQALAGPAARAFPIHFNLTHCGDVGYLAIAPFEVGLDVESTRPLEDLDALAQSCCSPAERSRLAALPLESRAGAFLRMWTRKEAALKAWGTGIGAVPLASVDAGTAGNGEADVRRLEPPGALHDLQPFPPLWIETREIGGLFLSVAAVTDDPVEVRMVTCTFQDRLGC